MGKHCRLELSAWDNGKNVRNALDMNTLLQLVEEGPYQRLGKTKLQTQGYGKVDGKVFMGSRKAERNVVFHLKREVWAYRSLLIYAKELPCIRYVGHKG